ncbi:hypothetical protein ACHHYP_20284 [Achlya hypogyna]|uniref:Reverse transcriptase zinc-binding domain-containing protein n=1 Tax=Achlya hypogyna TaxID=1202772 RepID=A0A1V9YT48_ACHHY|nr:hypothetical protein ACHHYP_20284 [Achlya hypogyna]
MALAGFTRANSLRTAVVDFDGFRRLVLSRCQLNGLRPPPDDWLLQVSMIAELATADAAATAADSTQPTVPLPRVAACPLPTAHLQLPEVFYSSAGNIALVAELLLPEHILPKYSDFIYRVVVGAVPVRARLGFLPADQRDFVFCDAFETLEHLLLRCTFTRDVWVGLEPLISVLEIELPTTLHRLLFEPLRTRLRHRRRGVALLWPILRACVLYTIWLARNDKVFRPDTLDVSPLAAAHRAAHLVRLHLHHLLLNSADGTLFRLVHALCAEVWTRTFIVPTGALTASPRR